MNKHLSAVQIAALTMSGVRTGEGFTEHQARLAGSPSNVLFDAVSVCNEHADVYAARSLSASFMAVRAVNVEMADAKQAAHILRAVVARRSVPA